MMDERKETRVLEYLEGDLSPEEERALLADAERDPELAALLADYRRQESLLHGYHAAQAAAADGVRRPDLSSLPAATAMPRRGTPAAVRWMAAAAAVALLAGGAAVLLQPEGGGALGTVTHAAGNVRAFDEGKTVALAADAAIDAGFERIKTPPGGSLEIGLAGGGSVELNENSTVRLAREGGASEVELERGEVFVHAAAAKVRTPWFAVEADGASFSVVRGLRGAEVAVARGTVEVRRDGTRRQVAAGEAWSSTGTRAVPVATRIAWSRQSAEIDDIPVLASAAPAAVPAGSPATTTEAPAQVAAVAAAPASTAAASTAVVAIAATTDYLPAGTVGFVEVPDVAALIGRLGARDLSDALLGDKLRGIIHDGIDRIDVDEASRARMRDELNEFFDDAELNLVLSSLGGGLSVGVTTEGPVAVAQVTDHLEEVATLVNETLPARAQGAQLGDHLRLAVEGGLLVAAINAEDFAAVVQAARTGTPTGFGDSPFVREVRAAAGGNGGFVAASDIQAMVRSETSPSDSRFFRRMGWENLRSVIASPSFSDDADNRALQMRFDGPRQGVMAWLDKPGPMSGFEFFSPDAHVLTAARIESPLEMLHQVVAWRMEDAGLEIEKLETDDSYLALNGFAASLGNEVVMGLDNPVLPVPNVKFVVELADPAAFHDGMLELVELMTASGDAMLGSIAQDSATYRNHLIVDLKIPGKVVGVSYAVVDDYAVFGPGRPFLQAAIDTFADRRSIDREPAFIEALPAKSGSNVSWLLFAAHNDSLQGAAPYLAQMFANQGVPVDLNAVSAAVPGRSIVMYAIADDDRIDYYLEGIKGDLQMTGMLPAVTQWLAENGG